MSRKPRSLLAAVTPPRLGVEPDLCGAGALAASLPFCFKSPQTHWLAQSTLAGPYAPYEPALAAIAAHRQHKLVHSVGMPLAGTRPPSPAQMALVAQTAAAALDQRTLWRHLTIRRRSSVPKCIWPAVRQGRLSDALGPMSPERLPPPPWRGKLRNLRQFRRTDG